MKNQPNYKIALLAWDLFLLGAAFFGAFGLSCSRFWDDPIGNCGPLVIPAFLGMLILHVFLFLLNNLYKRNVVITRYRHYILVLKALIIGGTISAIFIAVFGHQIGTNIGLSFIIWFYGIATIEFLFLRALIVKPVLKILAGKNLYTRRILIVGADKAAIRAAKAMKNDVLSEFDIVGFLDDYKPVGAPISNGYANLGKLKDLPEVVREQRAEEILIAINHAPYERMIHIVEACLSTGVVVRIYSNLLEIIAEKINVEFYGNIPVVMLSQQPLQGLQWHVKRIVDIVLAAAGIIMLSPFLVVVAIAIKLSSPGPVLFSQTRIGKDGQPFEFYKFRSMHVANDDGKHKAYVQQFIKQNKASSEKSDIKVFKITDDPRIFKFGKFIRKTSIDEFPQLYNVIKGDMSLVGPRPCLPYEWECYEEWHKRRLDIMPGCTGIWQALGRSSVSFEEMIILDLYYRSNMQLWLDIKIVLQTFPVIFLGKGGF
jgi:exopolysaccharide biosynthesis polyprenyl glycosylphosphotransferase